MMKNIRDPSVGLTQKNTVALTRYALIFCYVNTSSNGMLGCFLYLSLDSRSRRNFESLYGQAPCLLTEVISL